MPSVVMMVTFQNAPFALKVQLGASRKAEVLGRGGVVGAIVASCSVVSSSHGFFPSILISRGLVDFWVVGVVVGLVVDGCGTALPGRVLVQAGRSRRRLLSATRWQRKELWVFGGDAGLLFMSANFRRL
jgi:hypothetical protein